MKLGFLPLLYVTVMLQAADYSATRATVDSIEVVRLQDAARKLEVLIAPSVGNLAFEMRANGKNILWKPDASLPDIRDRRLLCGNPLLAPWANRIAGDAFHANGRKFLLNPEIGNLRRDPNNNPIHGLLAFSPLWEVVELKAGDSAAWVISRLEYWRYPELMAQFPFAHTLEMTYRLENGALQVITRLKNHARELMPVAIGYHPYFTLDDAARDEWRVHVAARDQFLLSPQLVPTGERRPVALPDPALLRENKLDDVFGNLVRGEDGIAEFWVQGRRQKIAVRYGPRYPVAVVFAPPGRNFICFEPMTAVTNAFNLAHEGRYPDLQSIPPDGEWFESFWIVPSGF